MSHNLWIILSLHTSVIRKGKLVENYSASPVFDHGIDSRSKSSSKVKGASTLNYRQRFLKGTGLTIGGNAVRYVEIWKKK